VNPDGSEAEQAIAEHSRPQDWGHPRWHYEHMVFTRHMPDASYTNHCHCWTDLQRESWQYPELFASLLVQVLVPGMDRRECSNRYLKPEDFWNPEWGKLPKVYDPEQDELLEVEYP